MFSDMLNSIQSGFSKVVTPQRMFVLVIFLVLAWFLLSYSGSKTFSLDSMETGTPVDASTTGAAAATAGSASVDKTIANPGDLLPADANSQWAALNPVNMNQGSILNGDMLQAGYHIGLDTIGQSMKNANLQLRCDPVIPKQDVGPWNQSTYEPDLTRQCLDISPQPAM
jgi:hypothetical protein